jgi:DNA-binding response OmpR family regulator/signal transduction histidine kinase
MISKHMISKHMISKPKESQVEILIAEDSPTQAEQLQYILAQHGYRLNVVRNGREALAAIALRPPTLVISDVIMPHMGGYELCSHIKRDSKLRNLPVILLTSLSDPADVVKGLESGADSFIFKPYDEQYLLTRVSYTLANRHLRENESAQMGVEVVFAGRKFFITSDRLQILNLLLSTYEAAVHKNQELTAAQDELRHLNDHLETRIKQRTVALEAEVVERKQAQSKLQSQLGRLDLLYRITRAIGERQDLQSIFQVVIRRLEEDFPIDFGCVCVYRPATATFTVTSIGVKNRAVGNELVLTRETGIPIDSNGLMRCVNGQLVYEPDTAQVQFPFAQRLARGGLRSMVIAPLLAQSTVFGVLVAARQQPHGFSSAECEFLRQLSEHVALAANQSQLHGNLQQAYDDLRQSQHTIMQQERLRALGQMASGVAHDINNAISPAALYTELLLEQEKNISERGGKYLVTIRRAIGDVAQTVARMREFCRPHDPQLLLAHIDLNQLVQQVLDLTRVRWRDEPQQHGLVISAQTDLEPDLPSIAGADGDIRDALTNLIFNAIDAMPAGGTLMLRTCTVYHARSAACHDDQDGPAGVVRLEVSDTGIGMDAETKRRCLEPFFTTKGERGTGLGLAMIYGMAQRHRAEMNIDSEPGRGTTIRLDFPISATATVPIVPVLVLQQPQQPSRLLLVDDDPLIVESLCNTLESDGHIIVVADGGQAGIDTFAAALSRGEPFAAVITDLGMPYVDGRRVAAAIKAASPSTPVIMLTGWGQRLLDDNEMPQDVDRVLNKPPTLAELRRALAELVRPAHGNSVSTTSS